jgi:hypothetical protein
MPNGDPATWVYVADLPTPPEVAAEVERYCQKRNWRGWFSRWWKKRLIQSKRDYLTCVHYFGGKWVVYKQTSRGKLILHVCEPEAPEHGAFCLGFPKSDRDPLYSWWVPTGKEHYRDWYHIWGDCCEAQDPPDASA